jgi:spore coat polysaccharide biosynthesis protein SpsF (cytidylyltransferase family)
LDFLAIIQARCGSTRLPGKILMKIKGKSVLEHVINRVQKSKFISDIVVATTLKKEDLKIVELCALKNIRVFCGSIDDVLDRFFQIAKLLKPKNIVRITSDCPLIDPNIIDSVIATHISENADYTSNTLKETFPDGEDVEVFTFNALKEAWSNARLASEREHVTPYIRKHPEMFRLINVENETDLSDKRWTLDEQSDFALIKSIYNKLYADDKIFGMDDILKILTEYPELEQINSHIQRNEGYQKSLKEDRILDIDYLEEQ